MIALTSDLSAAGWVLAMDAGHGSCGGWTFDPIGGELACACGHTLYVLAAVGDD